MIVELAISYVTALNGGQVPTIESAWDSVQASELERALKDSLVLFDSGLRESFLNQLPMVETKQKEILRALKDRAMQHFQL
jgi:hypothetical protein